MTETIFIDKFSDVGLPNDGRDKSKCFCPNCHERRNDKRDKSLTVNYTKGVAFCHYCEVTYALKKDNKSNTQYVKEYKKPVWKNNTELSDKMVKYWESRCIPQSTIKELKITEGLEFMPQFGRDMNTVQFNYFVRGELVNVKYRTGDKKFKLCPDAELAPYNIDSLLGKDKAIITEGECFPSNSQILTPNGWVRFEDLTDNMLVAAYDKGKIEFEKPVCIIKKRYTGKLVQFSSSRNNYFSETTPNHNIVAVRNGLERKIKACEINSRIGIVRSAKYSGEGIGLSDSEIRLYIAISADATIRKEGDIYFALKKKRKKDRLVSLLDEVGVRYSINIDKRGYYSIYIHRKQNLNPFKLFPHEWIGKLSHHQIELILNEVVLWDGNSVKGRSMKEYNSKEISNIEFIQTLCHLNGMSSTICKRRNEYGEWYKATMLFKNHSTTSYKNRKDIDYDGLVYCVTVSTGKIMVRQNNLITISGNCDTMSFVSINYNNCISVPNGASENTSYLDRFMEDYFDDKEVIYIAVDTDTKGIILRNALIARFGAERCKIVEYGSDCKDANEVLCKHGKLALRQCLEDAKFVPVDGIFELNDIERDLDLLYANGLNRGAVIGLPSFDNLCSFETKRLMIVTGIPTSGKTEFLEEMAIRLNLKYDWKVGFFSPESLPIQLHASRIISRIVGKKFGTDTIPINEYQQVKSYVNDNFFFVEPEKYDLDVVLEKFKFLVRRKGVKMVVVDPYNALTIGDKSGNTADQVCEILDKMQRFARRNDVLFCLMAHPTKMQKGTDGMYPVPTLYDISGAAHFYNKADFGVTVHRNMAENVTEIYVQKVKFIHLGTKGVAKFGFNLNNHRYTEREQNGSILWDNSNWLVKKIGGNENEAGKKELEFVPQSIYQSIYDNASSTAVTDNIFQENTSPLPF